jgi:PII-like signaling protein
MTVQDVKLSVYFGESQTTGTRLTGDALMDCFARHGVTVAALHRGIEGYGIGRRIRTARFPDISTDLPLLAVAIDTRDRMESLLGDVDRIVEGGLVTLEHARLAVGDDLLRAEFARGPGRGATLTVFCGRAEQAGAKQAYRVVVDLLRRHGAAAACVLLGVDGVYRERRERAGLFTRNKNVPMEIVSVGDADVLQRVLPLLRDCLERPLVNLERIALLKQNGEQLDPLASLGSPGERSPEIWQAVRIYTRQTARFEGRTLSTELTRRLRKAGAAGVTTLRGEWGFSGDEAPYGDRFGTLASHMPTYTVYIDRPQKIAEVWPLIDEVTAEHGIVTSLLVPGYRERAGETVHGRLQLPERELVAAPDVPAAENPSPSQELSGTEARIPESSRISGAAHALRRFSATSTISTGTP